MNTSSFAAATADTQRSTLRREDAVAGKLSSRIRDYTNTAQPNSPWKNGVPALLRRAKTLVSLAIQRLREPLLHRQGVFRRAASPLPQGERRGNTTRNRDRMSLLREEGTKEACHSAKRTHFVFEEYFMYFRYSQTLMRFAEGFANGFVLEKRSRFEHTNVQHSTLNVQRSRDQERQKDHAGRRTRMARATGGTPVQHGRTRAGRLPAFGGARGDQGPRHYQRGNGARLTEPWLHHRGRPSHYQRGIRLRRGYGGQGGSQNMCFSETNPPILAGKTAFIDFGYNGLRNKILSENGGFVLENEPTGGCLEGVNEGNGVVSGMKLVRLSIGPKGHDGTWPSTFRRPVRRSQTAATGGASRPALT